MADVQVLAVQQWLNGTYSSVSGWVPLVEDGITGWNTIYGLRRALQAELGISPVAQGFGPATTAAFKSQIGHISASSSLPKNVWRILSGSFWCKGYFGIYGVYVYDPSVGVDPDVLAQEYEDDNAWFGILASSLTSIRSDLGLSTASPYVDVKLMSSLLSMDGYVKIRGGDEGIRSVQQWLNGAYLSRADFAIVPCDGVYSRQVQSALLYALQYELGLADGVANGAFGPTTQSRLAAQGIVEHGSVDGATRFVRLFQAAMRFNSLEAPFDGTFSAGMESTISAYQSFMELPETGAGDYPTWCSLLVSCGDKNQSTTGIDTSTRLLNGRAGGASAKGYTHVGRYLMSATSTSTKWINADELDALRDAGLRVFPIQQLNNNSVTEIAGAAGDQGEAVGLSQGISALERCRMLGFPAGATVYFAIDFDPQGATIEGPVLDFFTGVHRALTSLPDGLTVGVYGTRNVCTQMIDAGKAEGAFVTGMSYGYSGNMGFPMPEEWHYNQIVEVSSESLGGLPTAVDHVKVSRRADSVNLGQVISPPVEVDGSSTTTGFDAVFEWVVRAEIACERALFAAGTLTHPAILSSTPYYVLHHLRKPEYWSAPWWVYTPMDSYSQGDTVTSNALEELSPTKPTSNRDFAHWAATTLGYLTWGLPEGFEAYGIGDLGGWAVDLLQAFGAWLQNAPDTDLGTWMRANIGVDEQGRFGLKDLVADADGWLAAHELAAVSGTKLSEVLRSQLKSSPSSRIRNFYARRFNSSATNVSTQFQALVNGIDLGTIQNLPWTKDALKIVANLREQDPLPTVEQAEICARALAERLAE